MARANGSGSGGKQIGKKFYSNKQEYVTRADLKKKYPHKYGQCDENVDSESGMTDQEIMDHNGL
jgi:hypothetical protein